MAHNLHRLIRVGVIGAGSCSAAEADQARTVGRLIARRGWALLCGGLSGVMEAACQGAAEEGGLTVGILPGTDAASANPYVRLSLPTGLDYARNVVLVRASQALIAVAGEYGTLSEIAIGLKLGKPIAALGSWPDIEGLSQVSSPEEAVALVAHHLGERVEEDEP
ncbi:MAG: TIGR00725 family protein [bacterium]|nr:TIGR00725 family protein [bacterium]